MSWVPQTDASDWTWSSDKIGFTLLRDDTSGTEISTAGAVDVVNETAEFIKNTPGAQVEIRHLLRSKGYKVSMKFVSKHAASVATIAGPLSKALAAKSASDKYQTCRGF